MPRPEPCPHPFPPKLNFVLAEEVRRLRRAGMSVTKIAARYGVAKSSISAVLKLHTYAPPLVIAIDLEPWDRGMLRELAKEDDTSDELLAADLLANAMDRRVARREVSIQESRLVRGERRRANAGASRR
jgi:lambda repressor-like predicted transcriptional regulator